MGKVLLKTEIKRETGKLYYCATDKTTGNICLCETLMARGRKKHGKK